MTGRSKEGNREKKNLSQTGLRQDQSFKGRFGKEQSGAAGAAEEMPRPAHPARRNPYAASRQVPICRVSWKQKVPPALRTKDRGNLSRNPWGRWQVPEFSASTDYLPSRCKRRWTPDVTFREQGNPPPPGMMEIIFPHEPGKSGAQSPTD